MTACFIGLGANLDDPAARVGEALARLDALPGACVSARSSLYTSPPWGHEDQPEFVNAVAGLETAMGPERLLEALLAIEQVMGRTRDGHRWGPRRIDLDLLVYGHLTRHSPALTLPHPRLHERAFVLVPLAEIAPDLEIPGQASVRELLARIDTGGVQKLETANEHE